MKLSLRHVWLEVSSNLQCDVILLRIERRGPGPAWNFSLSLSICLFIFRRFSQEAHGPLQNQRRKKINSTPDTACACSNNQMTTATQNNTAVNTAGM